MCAQVLQSAVCPEVRLGLDSSVSAIASVTDVELSRDMQVAKIYISVYSDPRGKDVAMRGLSRLQGCGRRRMRLLPFFASTACMPVGGMPQAAPRSAAMASGMAAALHGGICMGFRTWKRCLRPGRGCAGGARRYVRKHIAASINMRLCPEIRFIHDDSIQRGEEVRQ
jgi:ribosome-binding factor A